MSDDKQAQNALIPVEQDAIPFYGHELVAVRLADGRICAVLRWLCEGLSLEATAQIRRIRRQTVLAEGLVTVRISTEGGPQAMPALSLDVLPGWLFGIDEARVKPEIKHDVIVFQRECVKVLAAHFAEKRHSAMPYSGSLVPAEPMQQPQRPSQEASRAEWIAYYQAMAAWMQWQDDVDKWRDSMQTRQDTLEQRQDELESRMEGVEELSRMFVEVTERLGPATLTPEHQATVKRMAQRLNELAGFAYAKIYGELNQAFHVGRYSDISDDRWAEVAEWFTQRISAAERRRSR